MELINIKGIGPKTLELLNKVNIYTIDDLVRYYPYRYNIYTPSNILDASSDDTIVVTGTVTSNANVFYIRRGFNRLTFTFETNNINIKVVIFNRDFYKRLITIGKTISLIGKYDKLKNNFVCADIKFKPILKTEVEPVYHMVSGLSKATLIKSIDVAVNNSYINEIVPSNISSKYELMNTIDAIKEIHHPSDSKRLKDATIKLKYEELFEFMFKINLIKYKNQIFDDFVVKDISEEMIKKVLSYVPFDLTEDQLSTFNDIISDFKGIKRMNRLILGDVGSGKTIVSFLSILLNHECGYQSALLAPTEVLAEQHYKNFMDLFKKLNLNVALLVGSVSKKDKEDIYKRLEDGSIDVLIGTHAILEDKVVFNNLGLVITDEQHRFGVNQRNALKNKGMFVDVLYMSATPIPRTYALTIYGDMDISMIKQKPSGRKDIITEQYKFNDIKTVMDSIESQIKEGHQVYVIAPLIENDDEETNELNDLKKIKEILLQYLPKETKIDILHGKMKNVDKDSVMNNFKDGNSDILLSTTVVEVGVDVKNATVITIFNAERFGLATLHQLRGRVGRNSLQSYCYLLSDKDSDRLKVLCESNDGFYISEKDFELRGSGDLFGVRQSGDMVFKIANLQTDYKILLQCKKDTDVFIKENIENDFANYKYYSNILHCLMENN
jgi:ATP-dependent DNA helicase RecG